MNEYGLSPSGKKKSGSIRWYYLVFMIALAVVAMSFSTQHVAKFYGYQEKLGTPIGFFAGILWYRPWAILIWKGVFPDTYGQMEYATTMGQSIFLVPQFIILGCWFARRRLKGNNSLHGSARWASKEDIEKMGYLNGKGVYIGGWMYSFSAYEQCLRSLRWLCSIVVAPLMFFLFTMKKTQAYPVASFVTSPPPKKIHFYLRHDDPTHILCFAPTRSGKGVGLILPTLLSWQESSLVLDIKGENWALTSGWCKSQGNAVFRFDPSDASGYGARFNPLEEIRLDTLLAIQDAQALAMMIVDAEGKGLADHWTKAAFAFFSGIILHCCIMIPHRHKRAATLHDITLMLADESRTTEELLEEMLETDHAAILNGLYPSTQGSDDAHTFIASSAREMLNKDEKESSGVLSSALVNMALYRDPIVALTTEKSDFKIADLMNHEKPVNLYLVVSPADIDRTKPLLRLIVDMILRRITAKMDFANGASVAGYAHRLLFMLDEFTALGKLPIVEKAIAYVAGYGGKMYIIVQDTVQLNNVYGKDNAIMSNCHVRIAYAPNIIETAKMLSEMTGKTTVVETKTSLSGSRLGSMKNASLSVNETARSLLTPDECMRIPGATKDPTTGTIIPGDMLIFSAGQPTIYGKQILYFQDPIFSQRAKILPASISDSLYHEQRNKEKTQEQSTKQDNPLENLTILGENVANPTNANQVATNENLTKYFQ